MRGKASAGILDDGRVFFNGAFLFKLQDSHGLPLAIALDRITASFSNLVISWLDYIHAALNAGWKANRIRAHIHEAVLDSPRFKNDLVPIMERVDTTLRG